MIHNQGAHEHVILKLEFEFDLTAFAAAMVVLDWELRKARRARAEKVFLPKPDAERPMSMWEFGADDANDEEN